MRSALHAVLLLLAIAGELPFMGQTPDAILVAKVNSDPARFKPNQIKESLPKHSEKAIFRSLATIYSPDQTTCS